MLTVVKEGRQSCVQPSLMHSDGVEIMLGPSLYVILLADGGD